MTIGQLKKELENYNDDMEILYEYSYNECQGHPEGEYCYCGYAHVRADISYLTKETTNADTGKPLKKPYVLIWGA